MVHRQCSTNISAVAVGQSGGSGYRGHSPYWLWDPMWLIMQILPTVWEQQSGCVDWDDWSWSYEDWRNSYGDRVCAGPAASGLFALHATQTVPQRGQGAPMSAILRSWSLR